MTRIKTDYKISKHLEVESTRTYDSVVFFVSFYGQSVLKKCCDVLKKTLVYSLASIQVVIQNFGVISCGCIGYREKHIEIDYRR